MSAPKSSFRSALTWPVLAVATVLAVFAAGGVLLLAMSGGDDDADKTPSLTLTPEADVATGDPLDIAFTDVDGETGTLRDLLDGRPVVVNFFASWCTPCIAEMPDFEAVAQDVGDDVLFIGLAVQDRPEDATRIVDSTGITYRWSRDIRGDIANAFGATNMPTTIFLNPDGSEADAHSGALDADDLRAAISEALGVPA